MPGFQNMGYLKVHNKIIPVLYRVSFNKYHGTVYLKIRKTSKPLGNFLEDESKFLEDNPQSLEKFKREGKIVL